MAALASALSATAAEPPKEKALVCTFTAGTFSTFESSERLKASLSGRVEPAEAEFSFTVAAIDLEQGMAQMIGNKGAADVRAIGSPDGSVSFVEVTPWGFVNLTTVWGLSEAGRDAYPAATARHIAGPDKSPMVTSMSGICVGLEAPLPG